MKTPTKVEVNRVKNSVKVIKSQPSLTVSTVTKTGPRLQKNNK